MYKTFALQFVVQLVWRPPYNPETTYAHHIGPITLRFGDILRIVCKHGVRLVAGTLIRVCRENGSWSGEKPICKRNNH